MVTGSTKILEEKNPEPKVVSALQIGIKHLQISIACTWASRKDSRMKTQAWTPHFVPIALTLFPFF